MPHALRRKMIHLWPPFRQNVPVQSVLILRPGKPPAIHKQSKWPSDPPLMPLVIVSPYDTPSQPKLKTIPAWGVEDDDARPE
jgi:hypothetical protein